MKNWKILTMLFLMAGFIVACGDDDGEDMDPTLTVSLTNGDTYVAGDTVKFLVNASDDGTLETVAWTNDQLGNESFTVNDSVYALNYNLILDSMTTAATYTLTWTATDNDDNTAEQTIDVVVQ